MKMRKLDFVKKSNKEISGEEEYLRKAQGSQAKDAETLLPEAAGFGSAAVIISRLFL